MNDLPLPFLLLFAGVAVFFALLFLLIFLLAFRPWLRAFMSGAPISLMDILGMRLRGNPPSLLVDAYIVLRQLGVSVSIADVERTYMTSKSRVLTSADLVGLVKDQPGKA